uniref:Otopetrin-2 n=1 Tax=Anoplophora glabripennis TaxID=217634 RepID=V5G3P9_ANOGL
MDTVQEENSSPERQSPLSHGEHREMQYLQVPMVPPQIILPNNESFSVSRRSSEHESALSSRRPSAIIAALRRPSQAMALSAAQAVMHQRRYLLGLFNGQSEGSIKKDTDTKEDRIRRNNRKLGDDSLTIILSALYAKLLVVLGMAFPITEIISKDVQPFFYQGFYLYLYLGSISFVAYMYASLIREKAVEDLINSYNKEKSDPLRKQHRSAVKYGSFYLPLGAIAFGIGSMVYSGLEFGRYFEVKNNLDCHSNILEAICPATRMVLTLVQVQFIFLNSKDVQFNRHKIIARFGLMHMIATNLCEWLYVLVEETKHEIIHLGEQQNTTNSMIGKKYCQEGEVMGSLVISASPFLFPCTIEYSLICAVILFEMWKRVKDMNLDPSSDKDSKPGARTTSNVQRDERVATHFHFNPFGGRVVNSNHHFTVDCSNAHRGLFAGIMVIVLTIISLIMFFVLSNAAHNGIQNHRMAEFEVSMVELMLYIITTVAVVAAMIQLRKLKYDRKIDNEGYTGIGLDNTLLVVAQTGMFIYCMFSLIGCYFTMDSQSPIGFAAEIFSFIQTCLQTMFVLDGWFRRCRTIEQTKTKPGRELITFLIVANMAMWTINTLEKNRAEFRPTHLQFFGEWAWTIITHISMPMAIFYRFHSTICLFEIWKSSYKIKTHYKPHMFPLL